MPSWSPIAANERDAAYDLYTRTDRNEVAAAAFGKYDQSGLWLGVDRIRWSEGGREEQKPLAEIVEINLFPPVLVAPFQALWISPDGDTDDSIPVPTGGRIVGGGFCGIRFRDGTRLVVTPSARRGRLWDQYSHFVWQLHKQLKSEQRKSIAFTSGGSETRYTNFRAFTFLMYAGFAGFALFFVPDLPVLPALFLIAVMGAVSWFFYRLLRALSPSAYDPEHISAGLLEVHALPYAPPGPGPVGEWIQRIFDTPARRRAGIAALCTFAAVALGGMLVFTAGTAETEQMLQPGGIEHALEALQRRSGKPVRARRIEITPRALNVRALDPSSGFDPDTFYLYEQNWRVTHVTLFSGWREWDRVSRPEQVENRADRGNPFELTGTKIRVIGEIAREARARIAPSGEDIVITVRLDASLQRYGKSPRWDVVTAYGRGSSGRALFTYDGALISFNPAGWTMPAEPTRPIEAPTSLRSLPPEQAAIPQQIAPQQPRLQTTTAAQSSAREAFAKGQAADQRRDFAAAAEWYREAAEQGLAEAQFRYGLMYENGEGVARNDGEALRWYRKAADQGHLKAQSNLARMYSEARGVPQDYAEAMRWYRKAADQGLAEAQFNLGVVYAKGEGVPQEDLEALNWFLKAADQEFAPAQNMLGVMYHHGQGVRQNYRQAIRWYRAAAEQGNAASQLHLGTLYAKGEGVTPNYETAMYWWRKAADQGDPAAQYDIGLLYDNGLGMPARDRTEARRWMEKAAAAGHEGARRWLQAN